MESKAISRLVIILLIAVVVVVAYGAYNLVGLQRPVQQGKREPVVISFEGVGNTTTSTSGLGDCKAGNPFKVEATIQNGAANNRIQGEAICGGTVIGRISATDPGGGGAQTQTANGNQIDGAAKCKPKYTRTLKSVV